MQGDMLNVLTVEPEYIAAQLGLQILKSDTKEQRSALKQRQNRIRKCKGEEKWIATQLFQSAQTNVGATDDIRYTASPESCATTREGNDPSCDHTGTRRSTRNIYSYHKATQISTFIERFIN